MNVETGQVGLGGTVISGAIAGLCGWTIAIPFDVVKNRHQVEILVLNVCFDGQFNVFQSITFITIISYGVYL